MNVYKVSLIITMLYSNHLLQPSAITYLNDDQWGGRFGDKMMMYVKAKWVAHQTGLPFYYKPFKYSDQLMIHELETLWQPNLQRQFTYKKELRTIDSLNTITQVKNNALYIIHYYFLMPQWGKQQQLYDSQEITEWGGILDNTLFRNELRKTIRSRHTMSMLTFPEDRISVALHIRKGGGFDWPLLSVQQYDQTILDVQNTPPYKTSGIYSDRVWPLKFPPDQFYIDQIKRLSTLLHDALLYVHIFTDDPHPEKIVELYKQAINKPNITYGYRESGNHHASHILDDLFLMAQCDCLIRGGSNFPQIAQLIGNHRIVMFPKSRKWIGKVMLIDDVGIIRNDIYHS